jgi:hypothetical protein
MGEIQQTQVLTVREVQERVAEVFMARDDDELAHNREDALHIAVLEAIAAGAPNAAELARAAMRTREIDFSRYGA